MNKDVIFVQFYHEQYDGGGSSHVWVNNQYKKIDKLFVNKEFLLSNGFSSCFDKCKNLGDFVWIKYELSGSFEEIINKNQNLDLPIKRGEVYISAFYNVHLCQSYLWAIKYPNINFIVGGPAVDLKKVTGNIPSNLIITERSLVEVVGSGGSWDIEFPDNINGKTLISYPVEKFCYWGKCNFCTYPSRPESNEIDCNFVDKIKNHDTTRVFLYSPGLSPSFLKTKFSNFKTHNKIEYWSHLRLDNKVLKVLERTMKNSKKNNFDLKRFYPLTGVEFPSNRMLDWMNKGMNLKTILDGIKILVKYSCRPAISLIWGWNNLITEDIKNADIFFSKLYEITNGSVIIKFHRLAAKVNTPLNKFLLKRKEIVFGPFDFGFVPELFKDQEKLNDAYKQTVLSKQFLCMLDQSDSITSDFL